jgi:signal transduction histidine kinase
MIIGDEHNVDHRLVHNHSLYREQILTEQVKQIYKLAPIGFLATFTNSLIVFFIMQDVMRYSLLIPWLAAVLTVTALRMALVVWFRAVKLEPASAEIWRKRFLVSLIIVGIAWGSIGFFSFSGISLAHQVFIAFVLGGMAAGASSTFSMLKFGYAAYSIPSLAPLTLHFFLMNDSFHYAMGAMTALFGILLWRISQHNYSINRKSLLLRFENITMIESLKRAKERVEGLNSQLSEQIKAKLQAEGELRVHHDLLERVVEERTSALVKANEQLSAAKEAAETANKAKSEFLANMSHEMRTPLAGTLGLINLVLEMEIREDERQLLEMARRSADSLLPIISDVLDFSRLEAGVMRFKEELFGISEVVRTAVEVVSLAAAEKKIELSWQVEESVPEHVTGDEGRLRQVLVNLLGNSIKFTEAGQVEVRARYTHDEEAGRQRILFSVRDTGVGIPLDQIERIFGKFTQIDSSLTRRHGGTGLGLALTRQIVEKWGGTVWAESSVGVGSTFYFTFPVQQAE